MTTTTTTAVAIPTITIRDRFATNRERWMFQQLAELSKLLGIPVPETGLAYSKQQAKEMGELKRLPKRWQAWTHIKNDHYYKVIIVVNRHKTLKDLRHSIAHELIHVAFPKLQHGKWKHLPGDTYRWDSSFEDYYINSLLKGHMLFDGRGIISTTKITKPGPSIDSEITKYQDRKKKLETRRKRIDTAIKKIDRKIRHLEKKKKQGEEEAT